MQVGNECTMLIRLTASVDPQHQAYLNEFNLPVNRRFYPLNSFKSLLGIGSDSESPTYEELYSGKWKHPSH